MKHIFSKKLIKRLERFSYAGFFTVQEAKEKGMRLVIGREKEFALYWLVDEADGVIADAKFQGIGPSSLLLIGDLLAELSLRKTYDQASRVSSELIEQMAQDKPHTEPFPKSAAPFFNQVLYALDRAVAQCEGIPFASQEYEETPIFLDETEWTEVPNWLYLDPEMQRKVLEEVIEKEIRPYIELDAGGVRILSFTDGKLLRIAYEGSCTSCHAATGSTLSAIQNILRSRIHPEITVIPEL